MMYQIGIVTFLRRQYKGPCMVAGARRRLHPDTAAVIGVINRKTTGDRCTVRSDDFQRHVTKVAATGTRNTDLYRNIGANRNVRRQGLSDLEGG